nr:hypothetical protein [Tanacetum cinerariifolium]
EDIRLIERLLYDNSSPRPPEEFVFENSNANIESFSPSPILVEDSDSQLLDNYSLSLPEKESFYFDIPSFSRPPAKPPDGNTGILNIKMMGDISEQKTLAKGFYPPSLHFLSFILGTHILGNLKTLAKGFYPPSLHFLSFILGTHLLYLAGSQPMLKSSYKADDGVKISIPPLVGGVADVMVEIKGTGCQKPGRFADKAGTFREERNSISNDGVFRLHSGSL